MSECESSLSTNVLIEDSNTSNIIPSKDDITNSENNMNDSEDDNDLSFTRVRAKSTRFAESDSETDKENNFAKSHTALSPLISSLDDDSSNEKVIYKKKSRIKSNSNSDSESQAEQDSKETYQYELTRTKLKSKKLQEKFKSLKKSTKNGLKRSKCKSKLDISNDEKSSDDNDSKSSDTDDGKQNEGLEISEDENSCLKIKQNVVNKSVHILASICDPDTSDEESNFNAKPQKPRQKSTKLTSPKPVRMTAKVAMENMQKIKSESNRMLREKEVSLPYHRPKALSLKDIMSRRRPALTSDGKSLPIKMNNEQLQHYASLLEQRQKEMIELCKSDTEDEEENCPENFEKQPEDADDSLDGEKPTEEHGTVSSEANDKMFDITIEQSLNESKESNLERQSSEEQFSSELQLENVVKVNNIETVAENLLDQNKTPEINTETQNISSTVDAVNENIINDQSERRTVLTETVTEEILNKVETSTKDKEKVSENEHLTINDSNKNTEEESQIISLHYDTDRTEAMDVDDSTEEKRDTSDKTEIVSKEVSDGEKQKQNLSDEFSDNDFTIEDLDRIIEDAEINKDISNKPNISNTLKIKPKLTGAPGMVINLDEEDSSNQNKLTGVELLKERYTYFAKLKSLEDKEKDREKKFKPGIQHLKLKQELEEQIAEKRSLEWEKRLEEESKLKDEMNEVNDGEGFDGEDIEKIEAKLEETEVVDEAEDDSSEEEIEDDVDMTDKTRKRNPMVDDEAEESEDENTDNIELDKEGNEDDELVENGDNEKEENSSESDEDDDDSSESELEEEQTKPKKGRILKAFEDSDDEESKVDSKENPKLENNHIAESQDDDIQLAQLQRSYSEDLFTSQECSQKSSKTTDKPKDVYDTSFENDLGTQTFSILKSSSLNTGINSFPEKLDVLCETQPCSDDNFDAIVGMCTGNFVENLVSPQAVSSQLTQSQELGDDVAALCTGKFYDNPLISQSEIDNENVTADDSMNVSNSETQMDSLNIQDPVNNVEEPVTNPNSKILLDDVENPEKSVDDRKKVDQTDNKLLKSILDELDDPEFDVPKPNKYFFSENINQDKSSTQPVDNTQAKKKFIIESDDETNEEAEVVSKKKKRKKRKLEDRALQFSDDEEDLSEQEEEVYDSDIEDDNNRLVEYDSEENEVEIQAKPSKKKRVGTFFEQEAELTSEDEWVGSGDEDEAGLDRMEREEGDDDTFHQGKLQRELGEIHMREVLDQDKREVRLLQELLFEDGDLGDGHRQRKFRWKNADGEEEIGTNADEYADTQEDEFESEEQWRKQRHEREMFLRSLQEKDEEDANVTINRSALIKANLSSKTTPSITDKVMNTTEKPKTHETEKKTSSDIPSPKKPFTIFQQSYHNSLLTRGRGALARLAALATPLAGDDDAPKVNASSARGNFVFAAITPDETEPKVTKRKADANPDTPRLLKKMRKQDSNKNSKISILDHL